MTFKEFKQVHDSWREFRKKKPINKFFIILLYPFVLICSIFLILLAVGCIASVSQTNYRRSDKYRKVIKEGLFFDTVEYHEK